MDKTKLLNLAKSEIKEFEHEGETFFAKSLSVAARDIIHPLASVFSGKNLDNPEEVSAYREFRKKFVAFSLCDEKGKQLLDDKDLNELDDNWIEGIYSKLAGLFQKKN